MMKKRANQTASQDLFEHYTHYILMLNTASQNYYFIAPQTHTVAVTHTHTQLNTMLQVATEGALHAPHSASCALTGVIIAQRDKSRMRDVADTLDNGF